MNTIRTAARICSAVGFLGLFGCVTSTDRYGNTQTRFDSEAAAEVVNAGFNTYDRYQYRRYPDRPLYVPTGPVIVNPPGAPFPLVP